MLENLCWIFIKQSTSTNNNPSEEQGCLNFTNKEDYQNFDKNLVDEYEIHSYQC